MLKLNIISLKECYNENLLQLKQVRPTLILIENLPIT